jgi:holo-[acyl-carrier protein] synthase
MIKGIGTDIVKVERIEEKHVDRILSVEERKLYFAFASTSRRQEFLAARFAAKEALTKAFTTTGLFFAFTEMTILNDENGRPFLAKPSLEQLSVWLSLSHEREYAIAFCIIEERKEGN